MEYLKSLILLDILILFLYAISTDKSVLRDVSEVLRLLKIQNYRFQEYVLLFNIYFITIPIAMICMILVSYKIYTHDFIKPIQRSYTVAMVYYMSSILYVMYITDALIFIGNNLFLYKLSDDPSYMFVYSIFSKIVALIINIIVYTVLFLILETKIAFTLNSIPFNNLRLLYKNKRCIIAVTITVVAYLLVLIALSTQMAYYLDSFVNFTIMYCIAIVSTTMSNFMFYILYYQYVYSYVSFQSGSYRTLIE